MVMSCHCPLCNVFLLHFLLLQIVFTWNIIELHQSMLHEMLWKNNYPKQLNIYNETSRIGDSEIK